MILVSSCCVMFLHRNHQHLSRRSPSPTMRFHKCVKAVYNRSAVLHAVFCRTHRHRHRHRHRLCGVRCSVCEEPAWALCSASGIKGLRLGAWAWGLGLMVLHMDGLGAAHAASVHSGLSPLSLALACNRIRHVLTGSLGALSPSAPPSGSQRHWQMERVPSSCESRSLVKVKTFITGIIFFKIQRGERRALPQHRRQPPCPFSPYAIA